MKTNLQLNWRVRFKNPIFWVQVIAALLLPVLAYFGMTLDSLTSWAVLGDTLLCAVSNPYVLGIAVVSVWNAVNDPTTKGAGDSAKAMSYIKPR